MLFDTKKIIQIPGPTDAAVDILTTDGSDNVVLSSPSTFITLGNGMAFDANALRIIAAGLQNVYTGTLTVSQPLANRIFQRDTRTGSVYGRGSGSILLTISPSYPVNLLEHRIREANSPTSIVQDWTSSNPPLASGSQQITCTAPAGLVNYIVDLRANSDNNSIVSTTNSVMVGELVAFSGQSLAQDFVSTAASTDPATIASLGLAISQWGYIWGADGLNSGVYPPIADSVIYNYPPTAWLQPQDGGTFKSTWAVEFFNRMAALAQVPVGLIGFAVGGTGIDSWLPGYAGPDVNHWTDLAAILTSAGGKFGTFIWCQGHYETKDGNTPSNYLSQLQQLFTAINEACPNASYHKVIATIPGVGAYGSGPSFIEMVRSTAKAFVAADPAASYVDGYDSTLYTDLVHPSQAGNIIFADHFYRATAAALGLQTNGDKGPVITGASRAWGTGAIVLTVSQTNGGTAWQTAGTYSNQFQVFAAGTTTSPLTLASSTPVDLTNPTQITINLASAPTEPAAFDVWYRLPPDTSTIVAGAIYDNATDSDGITRGRQLWDPAAAINVIAPHIPLTVNNITATNISTSVSVSGTYLVAAPTALDWSLDAGNTWTAAVSPTISGGNYSFTATGGTANGGVARMWVRDHSQPSNIAESNAVMITNSGVPAATSLSNPIFTLDTYPTGCLFTDAAMTLQAACGDTVQGITDLSSSGNNFTQPTASRAPVLQSGVKNALPGLRFAGSLSQFMAQSAGTFADTMRTSSGYGILVVWTPATSPSAAAQETMCIGSSISGGFDKIRVNQQLNTGAVRTARNSDTGNTNNAVAPTSVTANTIIKSVVRWDGTTIKLAVNAQTEATATPTGNFTTTWMENSTIGVASDGANEFYLDGWIHEIRIWNTTVSDADRTTLLSYATSKWGS